MFPLQCIPLFHCHPCWYPRPQLGRFLPLPAFTVVLTSSHLRQFLPELAIPGICWDWRWIWWPSAFKPSPPSKLPLFLPQSFSLLLLALPAPLFCPSCRNRLKPTLCSGFLWSWLIALSVAVVAGEKVWGAGALVFPSDGRSRGRCPQVLPMRCVNSRAFSGPGRTWDWSALSFSPWNAKEDDQ